MGLTNQLKQLLHSALGAREQRDELLKQMVLQDGSNPAAGSTTNDSAAAGIVGEYVVSAVSTAANVPGATTAWGDLTSISLTAGDWNVTGCVYVSLNSATCTLASAGISTTTGNASTGLNLGDNYFIGPAPTSTIGSDFQIPEYRLSLAATTTVYLKANCTYSAGNPQSVCRLSARRVR